MTRRLTRWDRDQAGATLAELLVVMVVTALIATMTMSAIVSATRTQRVFQGTQANLDESRVALDRIRKEVRGARRVFEDPTNQHLQFWVDANADDRIQGGEIVHYAYRTVDGQGRLERWQGSDPTQRRVVARNLVHGPSDPVFGYDEPAPSTRVVTVVLHVDAGSGQGVDPVTVEAEVRLRNVA